MIWAPSGRSSPSRSPEVETCSAGAVPGCPRGTSTSAGTARSSSVCAGTRVQSASYAQGTAV
ncbi:hypothetical protein ACFRI7_11325 [Streptomyces sp. NPDC056716]|uniref:hypothetical protein n=1 Tax=Streptomyces sp. NPDC056716 TaxID=3345922 RepID=UPI0036895C5F